MYLNDASSLYDMSTYNVMSIYWRPTWLHEIYSGKKTFFGTKSSTADTTHPPRGFRTFPKIESFSPKSWTNYMIRIWALHCTGIVHIVTNFSIFIRIMATLSIYHDHFIKEKMRDALYWNCPYCGASFYHGEGRLLANHLKIHSYHHCFDFHIQWLYI